MTAERHIRKYSEPDYELILLTGLRSGGGKHFTIYHFGGAGATGADGHPQLGGDIQLRDQPMGRWSGSSLHAALLDKEDEAEALF